MSQDKLNPKNIGPYKIIKQLENGVYIIQRRKGSRPITTHIDHLKQHHGPVNAEDWPDILQDHCITDVQNDYDDNSCILSDDIDVHDDDLDDTTIPNDASRDEQNDIELGRGRRRKHRPPRFKDFQLY